MSENFSLLNNPLIAILRGLPTSDAIDVGESLLASGLTNLEVPLDSSASMDSLKLLIGQFESDAFVGAGTVLTPHQVAEVAEAGGQYIVSPNTDRDVIFETKSRGLFSIPGCLTPSEAISAIDAGADALKLFPGQLFSPDVLAAIITVLPRPIPIFMVGGFKSGMLKTYLDAGAHGFGLGASLYQPGMTTDEISKNAKKFVTEFRQSTQRKHTRDCG